MLQTFDKSTSRSELDAAVDLSPEDIDEAIEHLVEKNVVDIDQDIIIRKSTNLREEDTELTSHRVSISAYRRRSIRPQYATQNRYGKVPENETRATECACSLRTLVPSQ